jgi:Uma2 family endonuclease
MAAASSLSDPLVQSPAPGEQRIVLNDVTWKDYVLLSDVLGDRPGLHLTYLEGTLEIMSPSPLHEEHKKAIARLLELHALVRGIRILGFGSARYRREEKERGLEPDECYFIDTKKEYPDLAIEVILTSGGIAKLQVYEGLGVREVWFFEDGRFKVYELAAAGGYAERPRSAFFPDLDFDQFAAHVLMPDQDDAVRAYWDWLRAEGSS